MPVDSWQSTTKPELHSVICRQSKDRGSTDYLARTFGAHCKANRQVTGPEGSTDLTRTESERSEAGNDGIEHTKMLVTVLRA